MGKTKPGKRKLSDAMSPASSVKTMSWYHRILYPYLNYRLLLLLALALCLLQILVGVSFQGWGIESEEQDGVVKAGKESVMTNASQLSRDNLGVDIHCNVSGKEALSALQRAVTKQCKQEIVDLLCALQEGEVYPQSIHSTCPRQVDQNTQGEALGCFQDSFSQRLLQGHLVKLRTTNSPEVCLEICLKTGFAYAGVQYGSECFCGNAAPDTSKALSASKCNMPCSGRPGLSCGGYLTMQIYATGAQPLKPDKTVAVSTDQATPVRVVFLLTVSGRAVRQVRRLIRSLYSPDHYFLVHVDSRQDYMHRELSHLANILPQLRLVTKRYATIWGGASLLQMLQSSMEELLAMEDWSWDFVLNLSESDYPIKSRSELVNFLSSNRDSNFVKSHGREPEKFIKKQGLDKTFYECDTHMWRIGSRTLPWGVHIDGGSDWICLNRRFVKYVVHSNDELMSGLRKIFKHTLLPAESFYHTVLRNSVFCGTYVDNNLHITNWKRKLGCKCQYKAIVDWCGCSPNDFLPLDWAKLEGTRPRQLFFGRKFEPIINQAVINMVDDWVSSNGSVTPRTYDKTGTRLQYWQNVYHAADSSPSPDQALLVVSNSLSQSYLPAISQICGEKFSFVRVEEVTTYNFNDSYDSTLILLGTKNENLESVMVELKVQHEPKLSIMSVKQAARIADMEVSTQFDSKELVLRNTFRTIGPNSQPVLKLSFPAGDKQEVVFGWLDSTGNLAAVNKQLLNETSGIVDVKPSLKFPIRPGVWSVIAVVGEEVVAKLEFLVTPQAGVIAASDNVAESQLSQLLNTYTNKNKRELLREAEENEKKRGNDLQEWINSLLKKFYTVSSWCMKPAPADMAVSCISANWSSLYPDSKSTITGVHRETRKLLPY